MQSPEEKREIATNWREYLKDTKESFRVFSWVWRELIDERAKSRTKRLIVLVVVSMVVSMAIPWTIAYVIDGLVAKDARLVTWALSVMAVLYLVLQAVRNRTHRLSVQIEGDNLARIDVRLTELFLEKSLGQHLREDDTLTASNVEKGRERTRGVADMMLFDGIPALIDLATCLVFVWILTPVGGLLLSALLVVYALWAVYLNRKVIEVCTPIDAEWRKLNRHRSERWDNPERVKTCGKEEEEVAFLSEGLYRVIGGNTGFWLWATDLNLWRGLIKVSAMSLTIAYGAWLVWKGSWTVGLLMPLISWTGRYSDNLWKIGQFEHRLNWCLPSVKSMKEALTREPEVKDRPDAVALADEPVEVRLEHVAHSYRSVKNGAEGSHPFRGAPPRRSHVLRDVSLTIAPGEKVALMGESGAGKTTIMRIVQRFFDPEEGAVLVNGHDLRDVKLASWRRLTAYIPQQAQVFDGTVRYNLLYGMTPEERADITDENLWELMRDLRIDFGERLDKGLDTIVGRRGIKLSGGEAQRLMIGSAIIRRPRFLIVDEATSSLDSTTEKDVQRGLEKLLQASTSALIITHRLPTVRHLCSKFVVLRPVSEIQGDSAQVEAVGASFEHLYDISPTFSRLADDQGVSIESSRKSLMKSDSPPRGQNNFWNV